MSIFVATDFRSQTSGMLTPLLGGFLKVDTGIDSPSEPIELAGVSKDLDLVIKGPKAIFDALNKLNPDGETKILEPDKDFSDLRGLTLAVSLRSPSLEEEIGKRIRTLGARMEKISPNGVFEVSIGQKEQVGPITQAFLLELSKIDGIKSIGPTYYVDIDESPSISQDFQDSTTTSSEYYSALNAINAPDAWARIKDCRDVLVGIVDHGVDPSHPDLINNLWKEEFLNIETDDQARVSEPTIILKRLEGKLSIKVLDRLGNLVDTFSEESITPASSGDKQKIVKQLSNILEDLESDSVSLQEDQLRKSAISLSLDLVGQLHGASFSGKPRTKLTSPFSLDVTEEDVNLAHGTKVTGVVCASQAGPDLPSDQDIRSPKGVCPYCSVITLKALSGHWPFCIVHAIDYAIAHDVKILNCSWGLRGNVSDEDSVLRVSFERAYQAGVLIIVSAGNQGDNLDIRPRVPACYDFDNIICVTGLGPDFRDISRVGNLSAGYGEKSVDIAAPAHNVVTTHSTESNAEGRPFSTPGVSFATALVTGGAALVWSALNELEKKDSIFRESDYNAVPRWELVKGLLLLNAESTAKEGGNSVHFGRPWGGTAPTPFGALNLAFLAKGWSEWKWPTTSQDQIV